MRIAPYLLLLGLSVSVARAGRCDAQAPPTIGAELKRYGISLTQPALQAALKDKRSEVRSLAASELGEMKDRASAPLIERALEDEKDPVVKFNMATSLLSLDSPVGRRALLDMCEDGSLPEARRLDAASRLVNAGDLNCVSSVGSILQKTADPSNKVSALLILARVKPVSSSLVQEIHGALLASLQDPNSAVRQYASECIAALGDKAALPNLQTAIADEADKSVREHMEGNLEALGRKP
jgi:hypothetical protein